jgi:hypothetical protein
LGVAGVLTATVATFAKDPSVKEIMARLHKGANAPLFKLKKDLQAPQPNWDEIQKTTKEFVALGAALSKNEAPAGDQGSWQKLTKQYAEGARSMDDAAQKKNTQGALAAQGKLVGMCAACHKTHRQ